MHFCEVHQMSWKRDVMTTRLKRLRLYVSCDFVRICSWWWQQRQNSSQILKQLMVSRLGCRWCSSYTDLSTSVTIFSCNKMLNTKIKCFWSWQIGITCGTSDNPVWKPLTVLKSDLHFASAAIIMSKFSQNHMTQTASNSSIASSWHHASMTSDALQRSASVRQLPLWEMFTDIWHHPTSVTYAGLGRTDSQAGCITSFVVGCHVIWYQAFSSMLPQWLA